MKHPRAFPPPVTIEEKAPSEDLFGPRRLRIKNVNDGELSIEHGVRATFKAVLKSHGRQGGHNVSTADVVTALMQEIPFSLEADSFPTTLFGKRSDGFIHVVAVLCNRVGEYTVVLDEAQTPGRSSPG